MVFYLIFLILSVFISCFLKMEVKDMTCGGKRRIFNMRKKESIAGGVVESLLANAVWSCHELEKGLFLIN